MLIVTQTNNLIIALGKKNNIQDLYENISIFEPKSEHYAYE